VDHERETRGANQTTDVTESRAASTWHAKGAYLAHGAESSDAVAALEEVIQEVASRNNLQRGVVLVPKSGHSDSQSVAHSLRAPDEAADSENGPLIGSFSAFSRVAHLNDPASATAVE